MKTVYQHQLGFSLVEVLVSITVLLMVIVGPMSMISRANNSTSFATEQINAWFLAQEGLELIEKQRDDYLLEHLAGTRANPWTDFKTGAKLAKCFAADGCGVTIASGASPSVSVVDCTTGVLCKLYIDAAPARSSYVYDAAGGSNAPSLFTRVITMDSVAGFPNEVKVTATVTWRTGTLISSQKVEVTTYLFNIYDKP